MDVEKSWRGGIFLRRENNRETIKAKKYVLKKTVPDLLRLSLQHFGTFCGPMQTGPPSLSRLAWRMPAPMIIRSLSQVMSG